MLRPSHALKALGLLAMLLGLMAAFGASAAQAELNAHWNINGAALSSDLLKPKLQIKEIEKLGDGKQHLVLLVPLTVRVEILCKQAELIDALLELLGKITGKILYKECQTIINGIENMACLPETGGAPDITTEPLEALIKLHNNKTEDLVEIKPIPPATDFVNILFPAICPLGAEALISGVFFIKDCLKEGLVEKVEHLIEEGPLTKLSFEGFPMTIDGSALVKLVGVHEGLKWSGVAA